MTIYPIFLVLVATAVCSAAGYLGTSQPPRKLQPDKDQDDPSIYWDECWVDLPPDVQAGYITLGYTEELWTNDGVTEYDDYDYWMLPKEQKEAAISLGITEEIWCNDPDTGEDGCFVLEADIPPEFATLPVDDYDWWEIPDGLKEVLLANEYSEETWCNDPVTGESGCLVLETDIPPEFVSQYWGDSDWVELPDELKEALLSAGLNEESWCNDPETGENGCSVLEADIKPSPTTSSNTPDTSTETTETTSTLAPVEPDTNKDEEPSAAEKVPEPSDAAVGLSLCMITTFVATVSVSIWY